MPNIEEAMKSDVAMFVTSSGDLGRITGLDNLRKALFRRLVTVPGSLVHRPDYGVGIKRYQNAPTTFSMQAKIASEIRAQFEKEPRIQSVTGISIVCADDAPRLEKISVVLTPVGYTEQVMTFTPFGDANT